MSSTRHLCVVEKDVIDLGLNYMAYFEAVAMKKDQFVHAVKLATQKYAFLRTRIEEETNNCFKFSEISSPSLSEIEIKWREVEKIEEFNDWEKRLNIFTTIP